MILILLYLLCIRVRLISASDCHQVFDAIYIDCQREWWIPKENKWFILFTHWFILSKCRFSRGGFYIFCCDNCILFILREYCVTACIAIERVNLCQHEISLKRLSSKNGYWLGISGISRHTQEYFCLYDGGHHNAGRKVVSTRSVSNS